MRIFYAVRRFFIAKTVGEKKAALPKKQKAALMSMGDLLAADTQEDPIHSYTPDV